MELTLNHVSYQYPTPHETRPFAVKDATLTVKAGEFIALVGETGSGKSTLLKLLNGLIKPTDGIFTVDGQDTAEKKYPWQTLRRRVGLVFQYPEHQLFEMTVLKDVCYGPKNIGKNPEEQVIAAKKALEAVSFPEEDYEKSPFELSGGEKRRAAIAGVLAMEPEILILDEPTAGLDPEGRTEILELLKKIYESGVTVILVSHNMEDVAAYAKRVIVMQNGGIVFDGTPRELFSEESDIDSMNLRLPEASRIMRVLKEKGFPVRVDVLSLDEAKEEIVRVIRKK